MKGSSASVFSPTPEKLDRPVCHRADGERCTATCICVDLGEYDAGQWQGFAERLRRVGRVLTGHGVDNKQGLDGDGGGISCQGPTANFTPYITHATNDKDPFETFYMEPQYDNRDFEGRMVEVTKNVKNWPWEEWYDDRTYTNSEGEVVRAYEDGQDMTITVMEVQGDGVPDNPGQQLWQKPVRTGMTRNSSTSIGLSATLSLPLDGGLQERCKQAAETQIALQGQLLANKRLDFELARLKNCGELLQKGIRFHPRSPYAKVCADVVVQNVNAIKQHAHTIPPISSAVEPTSAPSQPGSSDAAQLGAPLSTALGESSPLRSQSSSVPSSQSVSPLFNKRSARGFASSAEVVATTAIEAVAVTFPALGILTTI